MQIDYVSTLIHKLLWNHVICIDFKESMVRPLIRHYEHECIWSKWVSSNERRVNLGGAVGCCAGGGVRRLLGWGREGIQCQQERPPLQCNQQFANIRGCHPPQLAALPHQNQHNCHRVFINSGKPPTRQKLLKNNECPQYWRVESNQVEGGPNKEEVKKNRWLAPTWYFEKERTTHPSTTPVPITFEKKVALFGLERQEKEGR